MKGEGFHILGVKLPFIHFQDCCSLASPDENGTHALSWRNGEGITPLIAATRRGSTALVQLVGATISPITLSLIVMIFQTS